MSHIHTEDGQHDMTAGAYIVRTDLDQPKVLLFKHKQRGFLMQPGGHIELHESPWDALIHEVREETGYAIDQLQILQPQRYPKKLTDGALHPLPAVLATFDIKPNGQHRHSDLAFALVTKELPRYASDGEESDELLWLSADELRAIQSDEIIENVREIALYILTDVLDNWALIDVHQFERNSLA